MLSRMERFPVKFPPEIQPHVDALVASALRGVREPDGPSLDLVTSWCEVHTDETSASNGDSFTIVWWEEELARWADEDIELALQRDPPPEMDDTVRLRFLRERLVDILDGDYEDADVYPGGCELLLKDVEGRRASLCFYLSGYAFTTGPVYEWAGVFRLFNEFRAEVEHRGGLTRSSDVEKLSDHQLLAAWRSCHQQSRDGAS